MEAKRSGQQGKAFYMQNSGLTEDEIFNIQSVFSN
jgi:hypothetical protein